MIHPILDMFNTFYILDAGEILKLKPKEDFIKLFLTKRYGRVETELHNLVISKDDVLKVAQPMPKDIDDLGLNIAFVMLDSVSAAAFTRVMPKSLDFLKNQKDTIFFKGLYKCII